MNPVNRMHVAIIAYFSGEKRESLVFLVAGVVAIAASVYLLASRSPKLGMAYPLIAIALIQLIVGGAIFFRTDAQMASLQAQLQKDPPAYAAAELSRMASVRRGFKLYKAIEITLLAAGLAGMVLLRDRQTLYAASLGLALEAGLMLAFDLVAERRADVYVQEIRSLSR